MPGKEVKNWPQYEKLRAKGFSKESAARITNAVRSVKKAKAATKKKRKGK